ncbi:MAG: hypothetical protein R3B06_01750 [Kofleriaceae bacterium]
MALVAGNLTIADRRADACGWSGPEDMSELTTFDPTVAAEPSPDGLQYDALVSGFGGPCDDCARTAMLADWRGYLGGAIPDADWATLLLTATGPDLDAVRAAIARPGQGSAPRGLAAVVQAAKAQPALRPRLERALAYVALARQTEALASIDATAPSPTTVAALTAAADAGLAAARRAKDPFMAQRFAFQRVRLAFYARDYRVTVGRFDATAATLATPSADLAARARYYAAGALARLGDLARSNLELARVHAASSALAAVAAQDFQPMEDKDWRASLAMAKTTREQTQLWRLVGIKQDGLTAAQEIWKLDPASKLIGLLVTRELARIESNVHGLWGGPDPAVLAATKPAAAALEQLATTIAASPNADRPWLMHLVAAHLAAMRGDVTATRSHVAAAGAMRPSDAKVAGQGRASLALALATSGGRDAKLADELAATMGRIDPGFTRAAALTSTVRAELADAALRDGRVVDAEFLRPDGNGPKVRWSDAGFLAQMVARTGQTKTAFDRFVLGGSYPRPALVRELAARHVLDGKLADAAKLFAAGGAASERLGTDPFALGIRDCHDCDHATYARAPWTHASVVARMATLAVAAAGKGQPAAAAALELGNAYYNLTWYGNARVFLDGTHQATADTAPALRWYKRAYALSKDREFRARAAFFAAKAELAQLLTAAAPDHYQYYEAETLPVPTVWYPMVKRFADTRYYQEILRECGAYAAWARP